MAYRADIDGLRAVAVMLVVIFHAKLGVLSGGYVGVDVFFVISGYLIASIIANDVAKGQFSVTQFYARRARRILPALLLVVLASTVAAIALLDMPQDLEAFARSARAALFFYSNFYFSQMGDYFRPATETLPLLHTWSLGVEEQFYLIAPLLLAPLMSSRRTRTWMVFAAVLAAFVMVSQYGVLRGGTKAFYWPHTRAFELMIGIAVASPLLRPPSARVRTFASIAGMVMIMLAAVIYTSNTPFPGFAALLPTLGTAFLIWSGTAGETFIGRALSSPVPVFLGKISYPLYLWHWPILLFAGLTIEPSPAGRIGLIAVALACAAATYYFVEVPIRRNVRIDAARRRYVLGAAAAAVLIWMLPLQAIIRSGGWGQRFGPEVARFLRENPTHLKTPGLCQAGKKSWSGSRSGCVIGDPDAEEATFVLWGDSHGRMIAPAISAWAKSKGLKGYIIGRGGCPPLIAVVDSKWHAKAKCVEAIRPALALAAKPAIKLVIIVARWARYVEGTLKDEEPTDEIMLADDFREVLTATVKRVAAPRRRIVLIGPFPEPAVNVPRRVTRALINGQPTELSIPLAEFQKRNARVIGALEQVAGLGGVRIIFPHRAFCNASRCIAAEGGQAFYVDDNHLSPNGVARVDGLLATIFDDPPALAQQSSARP